MKTKEIKERFEKIEKRLDDIDGMKEEIPEGCHACETRFGNMIDGFYCKHKPKLNVSGAVYDQKRDYECPFNFKKEEKKTDKIKLSEAMAQLDEKFNSMMDDINAKVKEVEGKEEPEKYYYKRNGFLLAETCQIQKSIGSGAKIGSSCCTTTCLYNKGSNDKEEWIKCSRLAEAKPKIPYKREIIEYCQDDIPDDSRKIKIVFEHNKEESIGWATRNYFKYISKDHDEAVSIGKSVKFKWEEIHLGKE
jgi:hypothetical protein